jgi:rhodanese-related sulfurtransferase
MSGDPLRKAMFFGQIARVGKALASDKRLELLDLLAHGERSVDALAQAAGLGISNASAHLQTLKHGGLVVARRDGTRIFYRLAGQDVAALYAQLREVATAHLADMAVAVVAYLGEYTEHVGRDDLLRRAAAGEVNVLDVRPPEEYRAGHIPGAISIPLDQLADRISELPADAEVVAYCRDAYCVLAHEATRLLSGHGLKAGRLSEGMAEWQLDGKPIESGPAAEAATGLP